METVLLIMAIATLIYLLFIVLEIIIGFNKIKNLTKQSVLQTDQLPSLSIILSALNEEKNIEDALLSLIALDYPDLEIIAVNDRSTDQTAAILERLKQEHPRLRTYTITQLPPGWFGKNHALYFASQKARGEWLLFTDADVIMKKDTLLKTMSYVLEHQLDHLTIYEHHHRSNFWLKILLLGHYVTYSIAMKPWRIRYSWSKKSLGHGAFNLVRRQAYKECGGHHAIPMECLDDLKLGKLLKTNGFNQDTVDGRAYIKREWYTSLKDMIHGWKKNSFAYYEYHILPTVRDMLLAILFYIWPFVAVATFSGPIRWFNTLNIFFTLFTSAYIAKQFRLQIRYAVFYPIAIILMIYTVLNSLLSITLNRGVTWRGTYYSLKDIHRKTPP